MKRIRFELNSLEEAISLADRAWREGKMVVYPTETCYGIGVDAGSEKAVSRLWDYKGGRANKAMAVAVGNKQIAVKYGEINQTAAHLMEEFLPGPITVIVKSKGKVDKRLESANQTLGIRIPDYEPTLALLNKYGKAITATSANTSGKKAPYSWDDLVRYTTKRRLEMIELFLDAGKLPYNPPSTVVDTTNEGAEVLREGSVRINMSKATKYSSNSAEETQDIGKKLILGAGENLWKTPIIVAMKGPLGAGKTQLVKGIAQAIGIREIVNSPTYQIVREYPHKCGKVGGKMIHIDTWRLEAIEELIDWNVDKWVKPGNVIALEWMEKAVDWIRGLPRPFTVVWVDITGSGDEVRQIRYFSERL